MSDFVFGVFFGITLWKALDLVLTMIWYGKTLTLDRTTLITTSVQFVIFLVITNLLHWGVL